MIRVLIVDDDKLARKGIIALMNWEKHGMRVTGDVQNGKIALEFVAENPVDLVFVDVDMPEMDGIEFMKQCSRIKPHIRFVVLTFYEEYAYAHAAIQMGSLDYISKAELEVTDCDAILERIQKRYEDRRQMKNEPEAADEQKHRKISEKWENLAWIFSDRIWKSLRQEIQKNELNFRVLERIIIRCVHRIDFLMGRDETEVPWFENTEKLLAWAEEFRSRCYERKEVSSKNDFTDTLKAVAFIREHFCEKIHSSDVANEIGISRSYFSSRFNKYVGMTFSEFLCNLRIDYAEKLLQETDKSILDISLCCGYDDLGYFNRVFREEKKCSPSEYREKVRREWGE